MTAEKDWHRNRPTTRSVSHTEAEIGVNCWYFADQTGVVLRLAAKAYALVGSDEEKLAVLKAAAMADHLTATHAQVPPRFVLDCDGQTLKGVVPVSVLQMDPLPFFDDLFGQIDRALPDVLVSIHDEYLKQKTHLVEPFLWVLTAVFESDDGQLIARVS